MTAIPQNWHKLKAHKMWLRAMNYGIYLDNSPGRKVVIPPFVDEATEAQRVSKLTHNLFVYIEFYWNTAVLIRACVVDGCNG